MEASGDNVDQAPEPGPLKLRHVWWVYVRPSRLFGRVEDTGAYGWALALLLSLVFLMGYAEVQTGLIDRVVDQRTEQQLGELEKSQFQLVDRIKLREAMEDVRKSGEFAKLMSRMAAVGLAPLNTLAGFLLASSTLFAAVALTGRKPEYHTLMGICVYAGYVELLGLLVRLAMMLCYRTTEVDTSLAMLAPPGKLAWLAAIDPFRLWFWGLVVLGLSVTQQLSRRSAAVACLLMCATGVGARVGLISVGVL
jgi:hypothetical protein